MHNFKLLKLAGLSLAPILFTILAGSTLNRVFDQLQDTLAVPSYSILFDLVGALLMFLLVMSFFGLVAMLETGRRFTPGLSLLLPLILMFILGMNIYTGIGVFLWFVGLLQYGLKVRQERSERLRMDVLKLIKPGLGLGISTILLAISLSFYAAIAQRGTEKLDPIEATARFTTNAVNQFLVMKLPGYRPEMTVDEFLFLIVTQNFKPGQAAHAQVTNEPILPGLGEGNAFLGIDFDQLSKDLSAIPREELEKQLPPDFLEKVKSNPEYVQEVFRLVQNEMVGQQITVARRNLLEALHVDAVGTDPVGIVLEKAIAVQLNDAFRPFKFILPPILALTLYFALQIFGFIYAWVAQFFGLLAFHLLKWTNFFKVTRETRQAEVINCQ